MAWNDPKKCNAVHDDVLDEPGAISRSHEPVRTLPFSQYFQVLI
jgi:hypothetical protein